MCSSHVMHLLINSDFFSHAVFPVVQSVSPVTLWEVKWNKLVKISISPCFSCTMGRRIGHFLLTLASKLPGTSMYGHICGEARICTRCTRSTAVSGFVSIPFCRGHRCCNWPTHFLHIFHFLGHLRRRHGHLGLLCWRANLFLQKDLLSVGKFLGDAVGFF